MSCFFSPPCSEETQRSVRDGGGGRPDDLSTLRGYVEALGGRLEVNAVFLDATVSLIAAKP